MQGHAFLWLLIFFVLLGVKHYGKLSIQRARIVWLKTWYQNTEEFNTKAFLASIHAYSWLLDSTRVQAFPKLFTPSKNVNYLYFFLGCYNGWHDDSSSDRSIFSFRGCLQYKPSTKIVFWGAWHLRQWYVYKANLFWLHRREEGQSSKAKSWGKTKFIKS